MRGSGPMLSPALVLVAFALAAAAPAQHQHDHHDYETHLDNADALGTVDFGAACSDSAARAFNDALALKHHMMYQEARAAFTAIAAEAPGCAMAHWGIAATYFQPLWPERPDSEALARGREHVERAREAGPGSAREAALVDAVAAFFVAADDVGYWSRIKAWADAMADAHAAHSDDLDIAALYGLSRLALGSAADAETRNRLYDEAEAALRAVWEREDTHPGAIHYSIHATDVDGRAENALDLVAAYSDIAPSVPHALHMPSHIYVRLGEWDKVIEWNRRSADAAAGHEVNGAVSFHYIHAVDYKVYGYLQQGRVDEAEAVYRESMRDRRHEPGFASAFHAAAMPARIAVEQRDWEAARALEPRDPDYLPWDDTYWPEGLTWYARGLGGVHRGDMDLALLAERRLQALRDEAEAAGESGFATYIDIDRRILSGWIAYADGRHDQAVELMESAAELEGTIEKHPITPGALLPPYEALGDLYLALNEPVEALAAYRASDEIWPGRRNTLDGKAQARESIGR